MFYKQFIALLYSKNKFIFALFFVSNFCIGQISKQETDSLLKKEIPRLRGNAEVEKSFVLCKKVIKNYETLNDKKGITEAAIVAANICMTLYRISESFHFLELAEVNNNVLKNPLLEAKIYAQQGKNYDYLGYESLALESYNKGISILKINKEDKELTQFMYGARGFLYEKKQNYNAFYQDTHKAHDYLPNTHTAVRLAKYHILYKKNLDSAKFYLDLAEHLYQTNTFPIYQKAVLKRMNGRYYFVQKDYKKAIFFYKESLGIHEKINNPIEIKADYKLLYEAYKAMGDEKKEKEYLEKYSKISDSMEVIKKKNQEIPLKKLVKENNEAGEKSKNKLYVLFLIAAVVFFGIWLFTRKKHLEETKEKETIIQEKEEETKELKLKVNEAFDEVVKLAKENSPEFLTCFQEIYPDFRTKILSLNPDLKPSELILSAYIYLGFTTKDIAEFTFKAPVTIKNNKYNLRKRLKVQDKKDLTIWLRNYIDEGNV